MMKKFILIALLGVATMTSCNQLEHEVTIKDKNGNLYTAAIAPVKADALPDTGDVIPIMKPLGLFNLTDGYVYNNDHWDATIHSSEWGGIIKREIVSGEVVAVK